MSAHGNGLQKVNNSLILRLINGILGGCEFEIDSGRLMVVVGTESDASTNGSFLDFPVDTIFIPQEERGVNFEILITNDAVFLRELYPDNTVERKIDLNCQLKVGEQIFSLRQKDDKWSPEALGILPVDRKKGQRKKERIKVIFVFISIVTVFMFVLGGIYAYQDSHESNLRRLNRLLVNNMHNFRFIQGRDNILYVYAKDQRKAIWVSQVVERGDYNNPVRIVYPDKETERIYHWLSEKHQGLKYFRLQLDNPVRPRLLLSQQRNILSDITIAELKNEMYTVLPYSETVDVVFVSDNDLMKQAEEGLTALGVKFRVKKTTDLISYTVGGELNDSELIRVQLFTERFYAQWGREFIRFNIELINEIPNDKSFSFGDLEYIKTGTGQWLFRVD